VNDRGSQCQTELGFRVQRIIENLEVFLNPKATINKVREALDLFEAKKVLEVEFDGPKSVRVTPSSPEATESVEFLGASCRSKIPKS
jgi:hypothetical protein